MGYENLNEKMLDMKDDIFASIKESIATESVTGEPEEEAPYGRGPKEALDPALALSETRGFRSGNVEHTVGRTKY